MKGASENWGDYPTPSHMCWLLGDQMALQGSPAHQLGLGNARFPVQSAKFLILFSSSTVFQLCLFFFSQITASMKHTEPSSTTHTVSANK